MPGQFHKERVFAKTRRASLAQVRGAASMSLLSVKRNCLVQRDKRQRIERGAPRLPHSRASASILLTEVAPPVSRGLMGRFLATRAHAGFIGYQVSRCPCAGIMVT